jgi:hypothetical protein
MASDGEKHTCHHGPCFTIFEGGTCHLWMLGDAIRWRLVWITLQDDMNAEAQRHRTDEPFEAATGALVMACQ